MKDDFVTFTTSEKLNITKIDKQHKEMSHIINKIYKTFEAKNLSIIMAQLEKLVNLLKTHFDYEEDLMKKTKFDGYFSHKLEHDRFYKKIESISVKYSKDESVLTLEELKNIKNWFHTHIKISDKKCGKHFVAMGIK